jgi:phage protein U
MEVGGSRVITLSGTLAPDSVGTDVLNRAAATGNAAELSTNFVNNLAEVTFTPRRVDLALTKTRLDDGPCRSAATRRSA